MYDYGQILFKNYNYKGSFAHNKYNGYGILKTDFMQKEGNWLKGELQGEGELNNYD